MNILWEKIIHYASDPDYKNSTAIASPFASYTYFELFTSTKNWIETLRQKITKNNQFLVFEEANHLEFIPLMLAAQYLGHSIVPVKKNEFTPEQYLEFFGSFDLITLEMKINTKLNDQYDRPSWHDPAVVMLTSGSTGISKAVALPHKQLWTNALRSAKGQNIDKTSVVFTHLSLAHSGGLSQQSLPVLVQGGTLLIGSDQYQNFKKNFIEFSKKFKITHSLILPAHLPVMPELPYKLKVIMTGSYVIKRERIIDFLKYTEVVAHVYGATESGPFLLINNYSHSDIEERLTYDFNDPCMTLEQGELVAHGDLVSMGYMKHGKIVDDFKGSFRTLDIFDRIDDRVTFREKKNQLIMSLGHTINPDIVEMKIEKCPYVSECLIAGKPNAAAGEIICLFVVSKNKNPTKGPIIDWCKKNLERHEIPRLIIFVEQIPLNMNKKPDRQYFKKYK